MVLWHRSDFTPKPFHVRRPEIARGTFDELARIGQVRGAAFVHEDLNRGIPSHEYSRRSGMIDVNVRQQYHRDVVQLQTLRL